MTQSSTARRAPGASLPSSSEAIGQKKIAILLLNLGGPLGPGDVKGFLYNLFSDKYIIGLPWGARHVVAGLIAHNRTKSAQKNYAHMGGGSPLLRETQAQAEALTASLASQTDIETRVFIGMRYWHPFIVEAVADIETFAPDEIVLLPLYPQFSSTTTLTAFDEFKRRYKGPAVVKSVCCYVRNDDFIQAHADLIHTQLEGLKHPEAYRLLFSAHGLPEKIVAQGDPYQRQVEATVAQVMQRVGPDIDHVICYQSRVGPMAWIGPSTDETIRQAARDGKSVIVVPIAFVSEHIETQVELDIDYAKLARESGVKDYRRIPALGISPGYIRALQDEVMKAVAGEAAITGDGDCQACHSFCPKRKVA